MGQNTPSFTMKESLEVVDEALRLLATPEQWTTGRWKCEIFERDPKQFDRIKRDPVTGECIVKRDEEGRQVFAYCIEGAVNQAVINKFGPIRAKALGALDPAAPLKVETEYGNEQINQGGACDLLSVNDITRELYADEWRELKTNERPAQALNDARDGEWDEYDEVPDYGYEQVMRVLRTKRQRLASAIAAKFHGTATA